MISIFDKYGQVRTDFSEDERSQIEPAKLKRFDAMVKAAKEMKAADNNVTAARAELKARLAALDKLKIDKSRAYPAKTFAEIWKSDVCNKV